MTLSEFTDVVDAFVEKAKPSTTVPVDWKLTDGTLVRVWYEDERGNSLFARFSDGVDRVSLRLDRVECKSNPSVWVPTLHEYDDGECRVMQLGCTHLTWVRGKLLACVVIKELCEWYCELVGHRLQRLLSKWPQD